MTGVKSTPSLEDKFSFFEKNLDTRELVQPNLSREEKADLNEYLDYMVNEGRDQQRVSDNVKKLLSSNTEEHEQIPKYLLYDIYNKFYSSRKEMQIKTPNQHNRWLFDFLTKKMNTYYVKGMTEQNALTSALFTKELVYMIAEKMPENGNGENNAEQALQDLSSDDVSRMMEQASQNVGDQLEQIESLKSEIGDGQEDNDDGKSGKSAGKGQSTMSIRNVMTLEEMYKHLYKINFNNSKLSRFIKDSLKFSTTYFSSQYVDEEESLLDAEDVDTLMGVENLVPVLRKLHLDDIVTYKRKYNMKFDVYIDISGSMGSGMSANSDLMNAKLVALKLCKLDLVQDIYTFDTSISPKLTKLQLVNTDSRGGTSIETVCRQIKRNDRPSVIITDASDSVSTHTGKAYFIGVPGARFNGSGGWKNYLIGKQCSLMQDDGSLETVTIDYE
tara:strand:- start:548 stop:1876 length:1329 start_codon:yes stop_codon:yes gene_type:complete